MKLRFSELYSTRERMQQLDFQIKMDSFDFEGDEIKLTKPVSVLGELRVVGDVVEIDVHVETELEMMCSRCLGSFLHSVDFNAVEKFTGNKENEENEENEENDEIVVIVEDILDIDEIIINNIISTLPIKRLCNNDCKGLCQECGTNLNTHSCNCESSDMDIRMAKLKELFN